MSSETYTCESCGETFPKGWSDEEAAAEAQENFPGIDVSDPGEAGVVCDGCYEHIMARARAEAPELIGPGWRGPSQDAEDAIAELGITQEELDREMADMFSTPPGYVPGVGMDTKCYQIGAGMVHVKPGCRC